MILIEARKRDRLMEFQLFWFGAILEEYLMGDNEDLCSYFGVVQSSFDDTHN